MAYLSFFHLPLESVINLVSSSDVFAKFLAFWVLSAAMAFSTFFFVASEPVSIFLPTSVLSATIFASIFLESSYTFFMASITVL